MIYFDNEKPTALVSFYSDLIDKPMPMVEFDSTLINRSQCKQLVTFMTEKEQEIFRRIYKPVYIEDCPVTELEAYSYEEFYKNIFENEPYYKRDLKGIDKIADGNNLYKSATKCEKDVDWKESVKRYRINKIKNITKTQEELISGKYKQKDPRVFPLKERGKIRLIKSSHYEDRVVQKSLNDNVLFPLIEPKLIYDNSASRENKGLDHSRNRFKRSLQNAYKRWGDDCYVLLIDFSKYFDNILHDKFIDKLAKDLDPEYINFIIDRFKEFEVDVSYLSDEEFKNSLHTLFNSLDYNMIPDDLKTGKKFMKKSVGIGSQTSQITGLYYPNDIDTYCKIVRGIKEYGRYMDDTYIILQSKEELKNLLENHIKPICDELGIFINTKKTKIQNIREPIKFLKLNHLVQDNGAVIRKVDNSTFKREHKRLRKLRNLVEKKKVMTIEEALQCYKSWRGVYKKYDSGHKIKNLDDHFLELFPECNKHMLHKGISYKDGLDIQKMIDSRSQ